MVVCGLSFSGIEALPSVRLPGAGGTSSSEDCVVADELPVPAQLRVPRVVTGCICRFPAAVQFLKPVTLLPGTLLNNFQKSIYCFYTDVVL